MRQMRVLREAGNKDILKMQDGALGVITKWFDDYLVCEERVSSRGLSWLPLVFLC
jgi:hypothetical protein